MARLKKRDIEVLLDEYDTDRTSALLNSLHIIFDDAQLTWQQAVTRLPTRWNNEALLHGDVTECDLLVKHLVEYRSLDQI